MTKEEYLNMYKEDKLAEICAKFEEDMNRYHDELMQCRDNAYISKKEADDLASYWKCVENLFEKLQTLPAKDFIELYYKMKELIENNTVNKVTCTNPNGWGIATINSR